MSEVADLPAEEAIDDALLETVREMDLRNVARKAREGRPLTAGERQLLEGELERRKKSAGGTFELEGEGASARLAGMTQAELAAAWGYSVRQLKNWLAAGRKADDPAPVRRPAEMTAWFERIFAPRKCPEKLALAAQSLVLGDIAEAEPVAPALVERVEVADSEKGLLAMLDRMRTAEATLHAKYMAAVDRGDENRSQFLLSEWSKMSEKTRALEKVAPKALEEMGIYVRKSEVQRALAPIHGAIIKSFRQAFRVSRGRLRGAAGSRDWNELVDVIVDEVALMLAETGFAEPLELHE